MHTLAAPAVVAPPGYTAITVSAAAVFLTMALLLRWKRLAKIEFLSPWFCLLGGIGLAAAFLQSWAHSLAGFGRNTIPIVGVAIPVVIAVVLLFIVCYDFWPKHPTNTMTAVSAFLLPAFGPEIGGAVGRTLDTALTYIATGGAAVIGAAFGVS